MYPNQVPNPNFPQYPQQPGNWTQMHQQGFPNLNYQIPQLIPMGYPPQSVSEMQQPTMLPGIIQTPSIHPGMMQQAIIQHGMMQQPMIQGTQNSNMIPGMQDPAISNIYGLTELVPVKKLNPTVKSFPNFDANKDAEGLRKAMKGIGTDEKALINILCCRSHCQRMEVVKAFEKVYNRNLKDDIVSETSGNFEKVLVGLVTPMEEFYASEIHEALDSTFKKLDILIDVLCLMTNKEINAISEAYKKLYDKTLAKHMEESLSGHLENMLVSLAAGKRTENIKDEKGDSQIDARLLKEAINRFFKDEGKIAEVFGVRSHEHIKKICEEYAKLKGGSSLQSDVEKKFSGDFKDALLLRINPGSEIKHFARRLHKSMSGLGTNDSSLIRLCITRCEIDMADIKPEFQFLCGESLESFIEGDTSGDYMNALLTLCGEK